MNSQLGRYCSELANQTVSGGAQLLFHLICGAGVGVGVASCATLLYLQETMLGMICLTQAWVTHHTGTVGRPSSHLRLVTGLA